MAQTIQNRTQQKSIQILRKQQQLHHFFKYEHGNNTNRSEILTLIPIAIRFVEKDREMIEKSIIE